MPTKHLPRLLVAFAALLPIHPVEARYRHVDVINVPVPRVIDNLERQLKQDPGNVTVRGNLARAYAMAYALESDTIAVVAKNAKDGANLIPWFGYEPPLTYKVKPKSEEARRELSRRYLDKALENYSALLERKPDDLVAMLGHAWSLEQAGAKEKAIAEYRKIIEKAWPQESKSKGIFGTFVTEEAAHYLLPLLDKETDKREIAALEARVAHLQKIGRAITPLVVPLGFRPAAVDLEDRSAVVLFDADGSGVPKRWTWIAPDAGWLVYDPHHTGRITSGLQLFGSVTFWMFWQNGYEALAALDDDGDGMISGDELEGLAVWQDSNGNGISEMGEVRSLRELGIVALSIRFEEDATHPDRIRFSSHGVHFTDGSSRPTYDIILQQR
jgi:tetratricopeptide (TPR) repeat protein